MGSVLVRLKNVSNTALVDFIEKLFSDENVQFSLNESYRESETKIRAVNFDMPSKEDIGALLEKCVVLSTYLAVYFVPMEYVEAYEICYRVDHFKEKAEMYVRAKEINFPHLHDKIDNTIYINNLVIVNTEAQRKIEYDDDGNYDWWPYDYIYTNLSKTLRKEVDGQ